MKSFNYVFVSLLILVSAAGCIAGDAVKESWWLTLNLEPEDVELNGLSIDDLNSDWRYAKFVDIGDLKNKVDVEDYRQFIESSFSFSKTVDLNKNGINELVRVGVYKDKDSRQGIFIAITEHDKLVKVLADSSKQNFSALLLDGKQLYWYRCMECGDFEKVVWSGSSYYLE